MSWVQIPSSRLENRVNAKGTGDDMEYPVIDVKATGANILKLKNEFGITVKELSKYLGMQNTNSVYRWFRGEALPTLDNLYAISVLFGVSMNQIIVTLH